MNKDTTKAWIFQARRDKWNLDKKLNTSFKDHKKMYLTTNQHSNEIKVGDIAFIWRAGINQGFVGFGKVIQKPTPKKEIEDFTDQEDEIDPYNETPDTLKAGLELYDVHTETDAYSLLKKEILKHPILGNNEIFRGKTGTVFTIDEEECDCLLSILKRKKWRTSFKLRTLEDSEETNLPLKFKFKAKPPPKELELTQRKSIEPSTTTHIHQVIQNRLYDYLCENLGEENVGCHLIIGSKEADVVVQKGKSFDIYEIKTSECPRECIKQALGQLLDYAYYEPHLRDSSSTLWVVGKNEADDSDYEYLDQLKEKHHIPIDYFHQTI